MRNISIICVLFTIQILFIQIQSLEIQCNKKFVLQLDKSIAKLVVVGQRNARFPTNAKELRPYCNLAQKTFDTMTQLAQRCLPKDGQDTAKVLGYPIGAELKANCKPGRLTKRARELLSAAKCANAGLDNWQKCNIIMIEKLTGTLNAPVKMRIPMTCCNLHHGIKCLTDEAEEVKECSRKTVDYVVKYAHKFIDPMLLIMCSEYSEPSDRCDRLVQLTPNRTSSQPKYKSLFLPAIELAESLAEIEQD